jgi:hypothetical protein
VDKVAKKLFGKRYGGLFLASEIPFIKNNTFVILWREGHWFVAYKKDGRLGEADSYGDDRLGRKYKDLKIPKSEVQKDDEFDCGQNSILNAAKLFPVKLSALK